jgi:hypothetical protein
MTKIAAAILLTLACTVAARAQGVPVTDDAREAYAGTWHGTGSFLDTAYSKAGPSSDTTSCAWQGDKTYLVCIQDAQTPYGAGRQLTIYARNGDLYVFQRVEPNGTMHTVEVSVAGNTWTYANSVDQGDKHVLFRTVNVFEGAVQRWHSDFSEDNGKHWTRMAEGVENRTSAP